MKITKIRTARHNTNNRYEGPRFSEVTIRHSDGTTETKPPYEYRELNEIVGSTKNKRTPGGTR